MSPAPLAPPTPSPTRSDGEAHHRAAAELLPVLMELKSWLRRLSQDDVSKHAGAPLASLALLERSGPTRISDLAGAVHLDTSVVSRQAKALLAAGLVEVELDPTDARARQLRLSDAGERALAEGRAQLAELLQQRLSGWSVDDLRTLTDGLHRLVDDLASPSSPTSHTSRNHT